MPDLPLQSLSNDLITLFSFTLTAILFLGAGFLISKLLRRQKPNEEKLTPYESGEEAVGSAWNAFSFRYYALALLFMLFEVEVLFLYPWALTFDDAPKGYNSVEWEWFCFTEGLMFIGILILGLAYAWHHGQLDWVKARPVQETIDAPFESEVYQRFNQKYQ